MAERRRIDIAEFRALGYLQEVNRLLLHPLGLALEVIREDDCRVCCGGGNYDDRDSTDDRLCPRCGGSGKRPPDEVTDRLGGVWDHRDDPEGIYFAGPHAPRLEKAQHVTEEFLSRKDARVRALGYLIQPPIWGDGDAAP